MAFDIANPAGTGTYADALVYWQGHLASLPVLGQERTMRGRTIILPDAKQTMEIIKWLETQIAAENATAGSAVNYAERRRAL